LESQAKTNRLEADKQKTPGHNREFFYIFNTIVLDTNFFSIAFQRNLLELTYTALNLNPKIPVKNNHFINKFTNLPSLRVA